MKNNIAIIININIVVYIYVSVMINLSIKMINIPLLQLDPDNQVSYTFGDIRTKTNAFVKALQEIGVKKNNRIGTFVGNSTEFLVFCLAANQIGAVICPLNPAYKKYEFEHYFEEAKVKWVVTEPEYVGKFNNSEFLSSRKIVCFNYIFFFFFIILFS